MDDIHSTALPGDLAACLHLLLPLSVRNCWPFIRRSWAPLSSVCSCRGAGREVMDSRECCSQDLPRSRRQSDHQRLDERARPCQKASDTTLVISLWADSSARRRAAPMEWPPKQQAQERRGPAQNWWDPALPRNAPEPVLEFGPMFVHPLFLWLKPVERILVLGSFACLCTVGVDRDTREMTHPGRMVSHQSASSCIASLLVLVAVVREVSEAWETCYSPTHPLD